MPNIMDEYILFMEKCFHKYLKLIYGDLYDKKLSSRYIEAYLNIRYSNYLDEESKAVSLSRKISKALDDTMVSLLKEFTKEKEKNITTLKRFSSYFYNLDQLYLLESQKKAIEKINEDRKKYLNIDDENFINDFSALLREDIKSKKDYLEGFGSNTFYLEYKKIDKNEIYASLSNKINFPEIYSEVAINKVAQKDVVGEDLTAIKFLHICNNIAYDLIGCNFDKTYYSYLPDSFFDKKTKLSRIMKIVDNPFVQDRFRIIITYKCFNRYKSYVTEYMRQGFMFGIYLDDTFDYSSNNIELLELFEKIFIVTSKYYYKDMKNSAKIKDRIISVDGVK